MVPADIPMTTPFPNCFPFHLLLVGCVISVGFPPRSFVGFPRARSGADGMRTGDVCEDADGVSARAHGVGGVVFAPLKSETPLFSVGRRVPVVCVQREPHLPGGVSAGGAL